MNLGSPVKLLVISHCFPLDIQAGGLRVAEFCRYDLPRKAQPARIGRQRLAAERGNLPGVVPKGGNLVTPSGVLRAALRPGSKERHARKTTALDKLADDRHNPRSRFAIPQWRTLRLAYGSPEEGSSSVENAIRIHSDYLIRAVLDRRRPFRILTQRKAHRLRRSTGGNHCSRHEKCRV